MSEGKLILLPNLLDEEGVAEAWLPAAVAASVRSLQGVIVESEKTARRYLRKFLSHEEMARLPLRLLNEHSKSADLEALLEPLLRGECWGLLSDAGLPCIADPGADLVWAAQNRSIQVEAGVGPCSLLLALQLSGLPSQRFAFHGYLPRESALLEKKVEELELFSNKENSTQVCIEAPYRSQKLLDCLIQRLRPTTRLCVAASLTTVREQVVSKQVGAWRSQSVVLGKEPAVFLFFSP
jgi:16S rRNA (cytidine1402-2'-O)-methyltransferase